MVSPTPQWLRRFTKLTALSTLFLIFAGAMVTSTGSGLAVPDWPLSYGMLMPPMVAGILFEHGHRLIAASVGLLVVIQAIWLQLREPKRFIRILGWTSLGAVLAQGLLGGLTVLFLLPHAVSIAHAGLAEIFFCVNVSIAFFTSKSFAALRERQLDDAPVTATSALVVLVYCQILAGALVRHLGAGLAIPDFPLSFGSIVPAFKSAAIAANFAHRVGAVLVTIAMIVAVVQVLRVARISVRAPLDHPARTEVRATPGSTLRAFAFLVIGVVAVQIFLGAEVVWSGTAKDYHSLAGNAAMKHAAITSFHVMTGAATLAASLLLALATRAAAKRRVTHAAGAFVATEVTA